MQARLAELREDNPKAQLRQQWLDYSQISPHLRRAIVAAEDAHFLKHEGFDWDGMQHALEKNLRKGRVVAGGSTISQQLAKNLFLIRREVGCAQGARGAADLDDRSGVARLAERAFAGVGALSESCASDVRGIPSC